MADKPIKINGQDYMLADLNDTARKMLGNIEVTDRKIAELKQELALFQVARDAFGSALLANLPEAGNAEKAESAKAKAKARSKGGKAAQ